MVELRSFSSFYLCFRIELLLEVIGNIHKQPSKQREKMVRMMIYVGLLVGAYYAGVEGLTHHEVNEMFNSMIELAISIKDDAHSVLERVQEIVENTSNAWNRNS